jgi:hypothetical protein
MEVVQRGERDIYVFRARSSNNNQSRKLCYVFCGDHKWHTVQCYNITIQNQKELEFAKQGGQPEKVCHTSSYCLANYVAPYIQN